MTSSLTGNTITLKEGKNFKMYKDLIKTIYGAFEMALLVKLNRYDQNVLHKANNDN